MCGWQVKLCDPLVTHCPYLSALPVVLPIIRRYTNHQITITLTALAKLKIKIKNKNKKYQRYAQFKETKSCASVLWVMSLQLFISDALNLITKLKKCYMQYICCILPSIVLCANYKTQVYEQNKYNASLHRYNIKERLLLAISLSPRQSP